MFEWLKREKTLSRLWGGVLLAFVLISILWIGTRGYFSGHASTATEVAEGANRIDRLMLQVRQAEKDFMLYDLSTPAFYATGETISLQQHKTLMTALRQEIVDLSSTLSADKKQITLDLLRLSDQYTESFFKLVSAYRERGERQKRLETTWTALYNALETDLRSDLSAPLLRLLLATKRDEASYLFSPNETAIDTVTEDIEKLKKYASSFSGTSRLANSVSSYEDAWNDHVNVNRRIGFSARMGLQEDMRHAVETILPLVDATMKEARSATQTANFGMSAIFYLSLLLGFALVALIPYTLYRRSMAQARANLPVSDYPELDDLFGELPKTEPDVKPASEPVASVTPVSVTPAPTLLAS